MPYVILLAMLICAACIGICEMAYIKIQKFRRAIVGFAENYVNLLYSLCKVYSNIYCKLAKAKTPLGYLDSTLHNMATFVAGFWINLRIVISSFRIVVSPGGISHSDLSSSHSDLSSGLRIAIAPSPHRPVPVDIDCRIQTA